jgi:hypothetical protein
MGGEVENTQAMAVLGGTDLCYEIDRALGY